jgi:hypothetical protein
VSTRSVIGALQKDGTIRAIYCHFDGYLEGVGARLEEHYRHPDKVEQLINLGNLSSLGQDIGEAHDFNNSTSFPEWCTAYGRDRGEQNQEAVTLAGIGDFIHHAGECWADYAYLFDGEEWEFLKVSQGFASVSRALGLRV